VTCDVQGGAGGRMLANATPRSDGVTCTVRRCRLRMPHGHTLCATPGTGESEQLSSRPRRACRASPPGPGHSPGCR
jgi:hypothetical protein